MRFLADENCDFAVVTALRAAGHDVSAIVEVHPGAEDSTVLALARSESRVLLTEDALGRTVLDVVNRFGDRLSKAFVVIEPARARLSTPPAQQ